LVLVREDDVSDSLAKALERVSVKMQQAMLITVANEFRARYEPAEAMPPKITALLKQLHQSRDDDP
jgi:hypothetical protein